MFCHETYYGIIILQLMLKVSDVRDLVMSQGCDLFNDEDTAIEITEKRFYFSCFFLLIFFLYILRNTYLSEIQNL